MLIHVYAVNAMPAGIKLDPELSGHMNGRANGHANGHALGGAEEFELDGLMTDEEDADDEEGRLLKEQNGKPNGLHS
jgi:hypothetical protein